MNIYKITIAPVIAILGFTAMATEPALSATFTITSTAESGAGTLREAIELANSTSDNDIIDFMLGAGPQTVAFSNGPTISSNISIIGSGADLLTIKVFETDYFCCSAFTISNTANVEISGLTITGGFSTAGAGIYNSGNLTLANSTVSGNGSGRYDSGGIYNDGTLTIINSTISNNTGGGIGNDGILEVSNSTISNNTGGNGGIDNGTFYLGSNPSVISAVITNSTITGNVPRANEGGGGITNSGNGTMVITNSTVSDNQGIYTGGITAYSGSVTVGNTIITGNSGEFGSDVAGDSTGEFTSGVFTSLGHNLIGDGTTSTNFTATGDQVGTSAAPIDPNLGPLQNNGGPTQTQALLAGSPAIDAGNPNNFSPTDQRGVARPQGIGVDIGAFELQTPQPVPEPITPLALSVLGLGFFWNRLSSQKRRTF